MKNVWSALIVSTLFLMSLVAHADDHKVVSIQTMNKFNGAVTAKFSQFDEAKKKELTQKFNAINQKVISTMQSLKALKPIFTETIKMLKGEKVETAALEAVLKGMEQDKANLSTASAKFNAEVIKLMRAMDPAVQKKLTPKFLGLNTKVIESPEINKEIRAAMDQVIKLLKAEKIDTADLEKMY